MPYLDMYVFAVRARWTDSMLATPDKGVQRGRWRNLQAAFDDIARRVHELGAEAAAPNARSRIHGEILGLCANCHTGSVVVPGRASEYDVFDR